MIGEILERDLTGLAKQRLRREPGFAGGKALRSGCPVSGTSELNYRRTS